jgi:Fe-S cluster assembly protein SufD
MAGQPATAQVPARDALAAAVARAVARAGAADLPAMAGLRQQALAAFTERGLPDTKVEAWRYTDLAGYATRLSAHLAQLEEPAAGAPAGELPPALAGAPRLACIDGRWSDPPDLAGVRFGRLSDPATAPRCAAALEAAAAGRGLDPLGALNLALLDDALLVEVADDTALSQPLVLVLGDSGRRVAGQARLQFRLGRGSSATVIIHQQHTTMVNAVLEFDCATGARLACARIQRDADQALHLTASSFTLADDAGLEFLSVDLGAGLARHDSHVRLAGRGARASVLGLQLAGGHRHLDNRSRLEHLAPATTSRERFHGIADGHGHAVFSGLVLVHPEARGTDARLTNRNLLLTGTAEIDSKPELEIYTDDVKCAHGATTGQLDSDALFYLRSRGIPPDIARELLIRSFAREVIDAAQWPVLAEWLGADLARRMGPVDGDKA